MKPIVTFLVLPLLLGGCASPIPRASDSSSSDAASLRVAADLRGNTAFVTSTRLSCDLDPARSRLGNFNPGADFAAMAEDRGFNKRVGMPGSAQIPKHLFAEYKVSPGVPYFIWVDNIGGTGGGYLASPGILVPEYKSRRFAAGFTPLGGRAYEIWLTSNGKDVELQIFVVGSAPNGAVRRERVEFDRGLLLC